MTPNKLIHETSAYLLQHAHNPVNWFPWGEEALNLAREQGKPLLVSIGYAACHWCHVMERESFEDKSVADFMNTHFINVKIDREERPDLDHIYMDAIQTMTGRGGWPLNIFLTPELEPFFGGTYFPPKSMANMPSWRDVLEGVLSAWTNEREAVLEQAGELTEHLKDNASALIQPVSVKEEDVFAPHYVRKLLANLKKQADREYGGFGSAPKFPQFMSLRTLLLGGTVTRDEDAIDHVHFTLDKMMRGGIYDQVGGGFARYSTDGGWMVPHFEKMLYDNALLISLYSEAYMQKPDPGYEQVIRETISFLQREMLFPDGGFYAALDADTDGEEGKYYVWPMADWKEALGEEWLLAADYFGVSENGNWEGKNILHLPQKTGAFAQAKGMRFEELAQRIEKWKSALLQYRHSRTPPGIDDKILCGWNALLITAYCKAFSALGEEGYREEAIRLFDWCRTNLIGNNNIIWHAFTKGKVKGEGLLDDYAALTEAAIALQEITGNTDYLLIAKQWAEKAIALFASPDGMFFFTRNGAEDVLFRRKDLPDAATPSGNSTMAGALLYLSIVFDLPQWRNRALKMISNMRSALVKYPATFGNWAFFYISEVTGIVEIVVTTDSFNKLFADVLKIYLPNKVLQSNIGGSKIFPLLEGKSEQRMIHVCRNYSCLPPFRRAQDLGTYVKNHMII